MPQHSQTTHPPFLARRWALRGRALGLVCAVGLAVAVPGCGGSNQASVVDPSPPAWSADGSTIAAVVDGDLQVSVLEGSPTRLTDVSTSDENVVGPTWSPDGSKIAYDICTENTSYCFVTRTVVRDAVTGREMTISRDGDSFGSCHVWSPDGGRLLLLTSNPDDSADVTIAGADGQRHSRIARSVHSVTSCPAWSPDGRAVAYVCCGLTGGDIFVRRLGPAGDTRRLSKGLLAGDISWAPADDRIAFSAYAGVRPTLFSIRADGRGLHVIAERARELAWSPDGSRIAFIRERGDSAQLVVAAAGGSGQRPIATASCCPRWSPDGTRIAYLDGGSSGQTAAYVVDVGGGEPRRAAP